MSAPHIIENSSPPATGRWTIDSGHAEVAFIGRHFALTKIRGRFTGVAGHVDIAPDPANSQVDVTIDMATVSTGNVDRDDHLRSPDLFDVAQHPTATFRSTGVVVNGGSGHVTGDLTIVGTTRPVTLDVAHLGTVMDPWGGQRAVFSATSTINREDWGLTWNMVLEAGGLVVSKSIDIEIEVELLADGT